MTSSRARLPRSFLTLNLLTLCGLVLVAAGTAPTVQPVALLEGAGQTQALLLGAWGPGRWLSGAEAGKRLPRTQVWQAQEGPGSARRLNSGPPLTGEAPCPETVFLKMTPAAPGVRPLLLTVPGPRRQPRPVETLPTGNAAYRAMVRAELQRRGLKSPTVTLTSVTRTDLDGDGTQEVIVAASHFRQQTAAGIFAPPPSAEAGDYSLVLLRWVSDGKARTTLLDGDTYTETPTQKDIEEGHMQVPTRFELAGVADLNADGRMELVLQDAYYEGSGASVLEWSPQGGAKERLSEGCGA